MALDFFAQAKETKSEQEESAEDGDEDEVHIESLAGRFRGEALGQLAARGVALSQARDEVRLLTAAGRSLLTSPEPDNAA